MGFIHEHAGWFIYPLIIVGVIWFWRGGTEDPSAHQPFIEPLAPLNTGETYGNTYLGHSTEKQGLDLPQNPITTLRNWLGFFGSKVKTEPSSVPFSKILQIDGLAGAASTDPQSEYIRIVANQGNKDAITLSGLTLTGSALGTKEILPQAVNTFVVGATTTPTNISMPPQGRAIIVSGKSPVGASFRVNICSGYIGQFQTFTPALREDCPDPLAELKQYGPYDEASCRAFVKTIPVCNTWKGTLPSGLSSGCAKFVTEKLSYNACVVNHVNQSDFYKDEWRIFLGKGAELWKDKQEIIRLLDAKGVTIDAITY